MASAMCLYVKPLRGHANDVCINYRIFKSDLFIEEYLIKLPFNQRQLHVLCKFRCRNFNVPLGIFSDHIIPTLCDKSDIPDEFHLLTVHFLDMKEIKLFLVL